MIREMYPASTIKAFVMASVYDQIRQGKMQYSSGVYSLLWDMITVSDNECYNELVRRQGGGSFVGGTAVVNQYLRKNGYKIPVVTVPCIHLLLPGAVMAGVTRHLQKIVGDS